MPISQKKKKKEFPDVFKDIMGEDYRLLEDYRGFSEKLLVEHSVCGETYRVSPSGIKSGNKCPVCNIKKRTKSPKIYAKDFYKIMGEDYLLLSDYTRGADKVSVLHKVCGKEYKLRAKNVYQGNKCPHCFGTSQKTTEEFREELLDRRGKEYKLVGEYTNIRTKVTVEHTCGNIISIRPTDILGGTRCTHCYGFKVRNREDFEKDLDSGYALVGDYTNVSTHVTLSHECGLSYSVLPSNYYVGYRCPSCMKRRSKEEIYIQEILNEHDTGYIPQKTFPDCRRVLPLKFDFYLPEFNTLIEFDGKQHFEPVDIFGGLESYDDLKERDRIKEEYATSKGIRLLRIPYYDFDNIPDILQRELRKKEEY